MTSSLREMAESDIRTVGMPRTVPLRRGRAAPRGRLPGLLGMMGQHPADDLLLAGNGGVGYQNCRNASVGSGGSPLTWPRLGLPRLEAAGGRIAVGWLAGRRAGRDAVECFTLGVAEHVDHCAECLDEGGQGVGAGGFAQVVPGRAGGLGAGAVEVEVVED